MYNPTQEIGLNLTILLNRIKDKRKFNTIGSYLHNPEK